MLQKAPKILAFSSILFVVGVLAYTVNTRYADNSIKGVMFDSTSSSNSEKYKRVCCVNQTTYQCMLECDRGFIPADLLGDPNATCDATPRIGNCRAAPPPPPPPPDPNEKCCNLGGIYFCAMTCPEHSEVIKLGDGVECTTTGEEPTCKRPESSSTSTSTSSSSRPPNKECGGDIAMCNGLCGGITEKCVWVPPTPNSPISGKCGCVVQPPKFSCPPKPNGVPQCSYGFTGVCDNATCLQIRNTGFCTRGNNCLTEKVLCEDTSKCETEALRPCEKSTPDSCGGKCDDPLKRCTLVGENVKSCSCR